MSGPISSCATRSPTIASCSTAGHPATASSTAPVFMPAPCPTPPTSASPPIRPAGVARRFDLLRGVPRPLRLVGGATAVARRGRDASAVGTTPSTPSGGGRSSRCTAAICRGSRPISTTSQSPRSGGLYLTPFFPAPSSHRYDADTFEHVDPSSAATTPSPAGQGVPQPGHPGHRRPHDQPRRCPPRLVPCRRGGRRPWRGRVLLLPPPPRRLRAAGSTTPASPSSICATPICAAGCSTGPTR